MSAIPEPRHIPVLAEETLQWLAPVPGETWVDATCGAGGHTRLLAERIGPSGRLIAVDQDPVMLALAAPRLSGWPVELVQANFDQLDAVLTARQIPAIDGLLADLGFSSDQLADASRGLSFRDDGPLDMRMSPLTDTTAADILKQGTEKELAKLFWEYGEERYSRRIARAIVGRRQQSPFLTTLDLAEVVRRSVPRTPDSRRIHPATRVFQALRIAVNDELGSLDRLLAFLPRIVKPGGRVGLISFHSLEDRRVKQAFRDASTWRMLTRKPIEPSEAEVRSNPRARSARLRVAQRLPT